MQWSLVSRGKHSRVSLARFFTMHCNIESNTGHWVVPVIGWCLCLSIVHAHCVETAEDTVKPFSQSGVSTILVFLSPSAITQIQKEPHQWQL